MFPSSPGGLGDGAQTPPWWLQGWALLLWLQPSPQHVHTKLKYHKENEVNLQVKRQGESWTVSSWGIKAFPPAMVAVSTMGFLMGGPLAPWVSSGDSRRSPYSDVASPLPCHYWEGHKKVTFFLKVQCDAVATTCLHPHFKHDRNISAWKGPSEGS